MAASARQKPRVRVPAGRSVRLEGVGGAGPRAAYRETAILQGWSPALRETYEDVQASWQKAAARTIEATQNSGFIAGAVDVSVSSVVGHGLRLAARPDRDVLGWTEEQANDWARRAEAVFSAWCGDPAECDAAGRMTFGMMQQAAYRSWLAYGEVLSLAMILRRPWGQWNNKLRMLPPSRIVDKSESNRLIQGVYLDKVGFPVAYVLREPDVLVGHREVTVDARDMDGRPNVIHLFEPSISGVRGISPMASVLKVVRQIDQYADATLTKALLQNIFAATIRSNISGVSAFEGLMTEKDTGVERDGILNIDNFQAAKGQWYDGAKIDLTQHGRIAHLFPTDELDFTEATSVAQDYDAFMGWLLRETMRAIGVTYESGTGDYRGATYSSVRMAGAVEWNIVTKRRANIVIPFCMNAYEMVLEEAIETGRLETPGGLDTFYKNKAALTRSTWTGPPRPQADDFKTARAYQVRKDMGATTLAEIAAEYGRDWDDDMRQQAAENAMADKLGLPRPWAPKDIMEVPGGTEAAVDATKKPDPADEDPETELQRESESNDASAEDAV